MARTSIKLEGSIRHGIAILLAHVDINPAQLLLTTLFNAVVQLNPRFGDDSAAYGAVAVDGGAL